MKGTGTRLASAPNFRRDLLARLIEQALADAQVGIQIQEASTVFHSLRQRRSRVRPEEDQPHRIVAGLAPFGAARNPWRFRREEVVTCADR